jgi:arylsulfatase A-like enzyme
MKRREFIRAIGLSAIAVSAARGAKTAKTKRPNILFIMADDHTSQTWGCYGLRLSKYARTKNIDRIAAEGAMLKNCFCTNSICVPSRGSILTGQYSHVNGIKTLREGIDPKADNVAKRLQGAGYETAIVGKWHLKNQPAGFDYYNVLRGQGSYHNPTLFETGADWRKGGRKHTGYSTDIITGQALKWLGDRKTDDKPFCLMCHFKAVHEPFHPPDRNLKLYDDKDIPLPQDLMAPTSPKGTVIGGWPLEKLKERYLTNASRYAPPKLNVSGMSPADARKATYRKFMRDYLGTVAAIDENIGKLLKHLDDSGLADNTVVIYTSDQGYFLGEHNLFDKRLMLEESLRMPFVIRYRGEIKPKTVLDDIVLNIDFAELMLDYASVDIPPTMQGRSFRANLRGKTPGDWRKAMYYHYWSHQKPRPSHYGIRTDRHKLIFYYGLLRDAARDPNKCWEFYDLKKDPHELTNQYANPACESVMSELKTQLTELRKEFKDTTNPLKSGKIRRKK